MKTKLILICDSCGENIKLDEDEYEKHIIKNHKSKINVKNMWFNASINRVIK